MKSNRIARLDEFMNEGSGCMSEKAKSLLEEVCKSYLMKEAEEFENDPHDEHTYESYVNGCMSYLKEIMGNKGYTTIYKPYRK